MKLSKVIFASPFLCCALLLGAQNARAQDEPQPDSDAQPKPAARTTPFPVIDPSNTEDDAISNAQIPDNTPLTGAQVPTLGSSEFRHSYWVPGVQYSSSIQSGQAGSSNSSWLVNNYVLGNLSLLQVWSRAQFALNYSGGGYFSNDSQQGNGWTQQFSATQTFQWNRLTFSLIDQFSYLPQSQFGFGGGTNLGVPGVGGSTGPVIPGLGGSYVPNQSIYNALGPRYSNAAVIQATYATSRRGSITASGSYGILRFTEAGNVDNADVIASLGYNYILSKEDTIGVVYRFSEFQYPGQPQAFSDQSFNIAYSRKLTGRLALQASGGPEITKFRVPIGTQTSKVGGNLNVSATYGFQNGGLTFGYLHGVSGGGGLLSGSVADTVNFGFNHKLSRVWTGTASVGYSRNSAIESATSLASTNYDSLFFSVGANRPFGRDILFSGTYTANISTIAQGGCTTGSCTSNQNYNYITLSFQWHSRPLILP
jgi:hypothetical protein